MGQCGAWRGEESKGGGLTVVARRERTDLRVCLRWEDEADIVEVIFQVDERLDVRQTKLRVHSGHQLEFWTKFEEAATRGFVSVRTTHMHEVPDMLTRGN